MFFDVTPRLFLLTTMPTNNNLQSQLDVNLNRIAWRLQREISLDVENIESLISKQLPTDPEEREKDRKRREKMIGDLFVAATEVLTETQFQFFSAYYILGMSEMQIADSFGVTQPYISTCLSASIKKIKKHLDL